MSDPTATAPSALLEQRLAVAQAALAERNHELLLARRRMDELVGFREALDGEQCAAFLVIDASGYVTQANQRAAMLLGRNVTVLRGTAVSELILGGFTSLRQSATEGSGLFDGSPRTCVLPNGLRLPIYCSLTIVAQSEGEPTSYLLVAVPADARGAIEHARTQQQQGAALGRLADGIAHEINTPLQFIGDSIRYLCDAFTELQPLMGTLPRLIAAGRLDPSTCDTAAFAEKALAEADLDFARREVPLAATRALEGLKRIATVVDTTRDVASGGKYGKALIDLNALVRHCVNLSRHHWEPLATLDLHLAAALPKVTCHIAEICDAVLQMLANSTHSISNRPKGQNAGHITISTRLSGAQIELTVTDDAGSGPRRLDLIERVVVGQHGGEVNATNDATGGAAVTVRLPIDPEPLK